MQKILAIAYVAVFIFCTTHARHARMIMLFDLLNDETSQSEKSVDAKVVMFNGIRALYEKTAPILLSTNLWHQMLFHYKEFKKDLHKTYSPEYEYHQMYLKITHYCTDLFSSLSASTSTKKKTELTKKIQEKLNNDTEYKKYKRERKYLEMRNLAEANFITAAHDVYVIMHDFFNPKEWDMYSLEKPFMLCIPHAYIQECVQAFTEEAKKFNMLEQILENMPNLTVEEIAVGLQLKRHESARITGDTSDALPLLQEQISDEDISTLQDTSYLMDTIFEQLFITKMAVPENIKMHLDFILPTWNFFLDGHGGYSFVPPEFETVRTEIEKLQKEIGFSMSKPEIPHANARAQKKRDQNEKIEHLERLQQEMSHILLDARGSIASLSIATFSSMLDYFNNNILTSMLLYFSCYTGGQHAELPFIYKAIQKTYNFTLISAASSDVETTSTLPYFTVHNLEAEDFVITEKRATLNFIRHISYQKFFELQEHNDTLVRVINTVIPPLEANAPAIRLPGITWFSPMRLSGTVNLNRIAISNALKKGTFSLHDARLVLLHTSSVPLELVITTSPSYARQTEKELKQDAAFSLSLAQNKLELLDAQKTPLFISMLPGNVVSWIKKISAPERFFTSFLDTMLSNTIAGEKIYLVDTLHAFNNINNTKWNSSFNNPSSRKFISIEQFVPTIFENVTFFNHLSADPLDVESHDFDLVGVFFTVKDKGYRGIYSKWSPAEEHSAPNDGDDQPPTSEEEFLEESEQAYTETAPPLETTQDKLYPFSKIEEMTDEELSRYKEWYAAQKAKAQESAHMLIETSNIEDFIHSHGQKVKKVQPH
ncbi:MAG TPA: hypothetical protein VEK38_00750 [Candidatus Bathyarchaeia archaeon]|nr:hypothetical protein [Candidatus Bathyarchaeia archaeon]